MLLGIDYGHFYFKNSIFDFKLLITDFKPTIDNQEKSAQSEFYSVSSSTLLSLSPHFNPT
jgi:hypothetical protein